MFKAGLYLQQLGLISGIRAVLLDEDYFSPEAKEHFYRNYMEPAGVALVDEVPEYAKKRIRAGRAWLIY